MVYIPHINQINTVLTLFFNTKLLLCFVDHASRHNGVKENQLDSQFILSIFRQPLHVSGISRSIIRGYNRMHTTIGTYYSEKRIV
jgi:hypothetical protein